MDISALRSAGCSFVCQPTSSGSGKEDPHTRPRYEAAVKKSHSVPCGVSSRSATRGFSEGLAVIPARVEVVQMRKPFHKLFFLLGVLLVASPVIARADDVTDDQDTPAMWRLHSLRVGATKLRTSLANDPDTIWIGHIADAGWVPKDRNGNPVPSSPRGPGGTAAPPYVAGTVMTGCYGPFHVGRGDNLPGGDVTQGVAGGAGTHFNGVWDWDHFQAGDDSLQGWWPVARPGQSEGGGNTNDKVRAFFGLNYGNQGNYVINQGAGAK